MCFVSVICIVLLALLLCSILCLFGRRCLVFFSLECSLAKEGVAYFFGCLGFKEWLRFECFNVRIELFHSRLPLSGKIVPVHTSVFFRFAVDEAAAALFISLFM